MPLAADTFNARFWPAAKLTGMLDAMTLLDETPPRDIDVAFTMPDTTRNNGTRSRDFKIEYVHADAPDLRQGARVSIDGTDYTVREKPYVPENPQQINGGDGYWRQALLSPA